MRSLDSYLVTLFSVHLLGLLNRIFFVGYYDCLFCKNRYNIVTLQVIIHFLWCFCRVQKHKKVSFGVSVVCRSAKKFHLVFLTRAEARKSFIWCFCRVQKHEKVSFGVSGMSRSMKQFHLVFLT